MTSTALHDQAGGGLSADFAGYVVRRAVIDAQARGTTNGEQWSAGTSMGPLEKIEARSPTKGGVEDRRH